MMGRAVYRSPAILADVDARIYGQEQAAAGERKRGEFGEGVGGGVGEKNDYHDGWGDGGERSASSFFCTTSSSPMCATRHDVLERYSVYSGGSCTS
jgi:hypothetical protein